MKRLTTRTARLRQIEEMLILKPQGMRASRLAQALHVHRRTIYRDLDFLHEQGVPLWQENGTFGINRTRYQNTVRLSYHESVALVLAGLLLARTLDERNRHVIAALRRLAVTLPEPFTTHLARAAERAQSQKADHRHTAVLEAVAEAWGTGRKVQITYRPPRGSTLHTRVLAPYTLEPTPAGIYLIGHDQGANALRTYKLERLTGAQVLAEPYTIPDDFDPEEHLAHSWSIMTGEQIEAVVLRFTPESAPYVSERVWHPSQETVPDSGGGVLLSIHVSAPREMLPWIRSWGASVEVLSPPWLRERVARELAHAASQYQGTGSITH